MLPINRSNLEPGAEDHPLWRPPLARLIILMLTGLSLFVFNFLLSPMTQVEVNALDYQPTITSSRVTIPAVLTVPPTPTPTSGQNALNYSTPGESPGSPLDMGAIVLSMNEGGYNRLFAYQPIRMPFTRLTNGSWDDITPAFSPDGSRLAFSSNRDGYWDLYLMELSSGEITRLTNTLNYDASPSWSPDGKFLAYETFEDDLEIKIMVAGSEQPPISLSAHPAADYEPSWSPQGRQIAFISTRDGEPDVWVADLDKVDEARFINLSQTPDARESHPIWSPDGRKLAWASVEDGRHSIYVWDPESGISYLGSGDFPVWNPDGTILLTLLSEPNRDSITAYVYSAKGDRSTGVQLALPPFVLPGSVDGLTWGVTFLPTNLPENIAAAAQATPAPLWQPNVSHPTDLAVTRFVLADLEGVNAPYPRLHDRVDESFNALRQRVAIETGWDFLATLENAFVPLTSPLAPGMGEDWLYTGRAFAFNPLPINAGWIVITQERFGSDIYWRVFLRARYQDGTQGRPLHHQIWDFNARYSGDPLAYEQGGKLSEDVPPGYWVDFTRLARAFGWERLPALPIWRSAYFAARFNEFVQAFGEKWRQAMLELYPPEALQTPTPLPPPTLTPTPTPWWKRNP